MIKEFVARYVVLQDFIEAAFINKRPEGYEDVLKTALTACNFHEGEDGWESNYPDPLRITTIDYGHYQGSLVFVIACKGYQPYKYWYTRVSYGSCGHCDAFQAVADEDNGDVCSPESAKGYYTLGLHMMQQMREMGDECSED